MLDTLMLWELSVTEQRYRTALEAMARVSVTEVAELVHGISESSRTIRGLSELGGCLPSRELRWVAGVSRNRRRSASLGLLCQRCIRPFATFESAPHVSAAYRSSVVHVVQQHR